MEIEKGQDRQSDRMRNMRTDSLTDREREREMWTCSLGVLQSSLESEKEIEKKKRHWGRQNMKRGRKAGKDVVLKSKQAGKS